MVLSKYRYFKTIVYIQYVKLYSISVQNTVENDSSVEAFGQKSFIVVVFRGNPRTIRVNTQLP